MSSEELTAARRARYEMKKLLAIRLAGGPLHKPHNGLKTLAKTCTKCGSFNTLPDLSDLRGSTPIDCPKCRAARREKNRARYAETARARRQRPGVAAQAAKRVNAWQRATNAASAEGAQRSAERSVWTSAEYELAARSDLTAREIGKMTGRTIAAVQNARHRIRTEPKYARLAGVDSPLADLAAPETINIAPRYEG